MPGSDLVALLYDAWDDLDRAFRDLSEESSTQRFRGGSAYAWTFAHAAQQIDTTVNVRAQDAEPDPVVNREEFGFGGTGEGPGWSQIRDASTAVRDRARAFLEPLLDADLRNIKVPSQSLRREVNLEYYLCRIIAHHWFHTGEVASKREMDGQETGVYPGMMGNFRAATGDSTVEQAEPGGSIFVRLLKDAWDDADRAFANLSDVDATEPHFNGSPIGWTLAHFTGQMNMFGAVLLGRGEHPGIFERPTINESAPMSAEDWAEVQRAVKTTRQDIGGFLHGLGATELAEMTVPATSRTPEVHLKYMLGRFIAHNYFHVGEVASKRDMLGHDVGDYPGTMRHSLGH